MVFIYCLHLSLVLPLAIAWNVTRQDHGDSFDDIYTKEICVAQELHWVEPDVTCVCPHDGTFIGVNDSKIICSSSIDGTSSTLLTLCFYVLEDVKWLF